MSDKPSLEIKPLHVPAILFAFLFGIGILLTLSFKALTFITILVTAYLINKETFYKICPAEWYENEIKIHPKEWHTVPNGEKNYPFYYGLLVGVFGSVASIIIPTIGDTLVFGGSLLGFLLFFVLYHAALFNYAEHYGMASTREKLKADTNKNT